MSQMPDKIWLHKDTKYSTGDIVCGYQYEFAEGIEDEGGIENFVEYVHKDSFTEDIKKADKFDVPQIKFKDAIEVTSRMKYIDDDLKPIAEFIMDYCSWNLHKDECNQPRIEVPLFRVLDALILRGKPYCEG